MANGYVTQFEVSSATHLFHSLILKTPYGIIYFYDVLLIQINMINIQMKTTILLQFIAYIYRIMCLPHFWINPSALNVTSHIPLSTLDIMRLTSTRLPYEVDDISVLVHNGYPPNKPNLYAVCYF